jgi:hypothetical protein
MSTLDQLLAQAGITRDQIASNVAALSRPQPDDFWAEITSVVQRHFPQLEAQEARERAWAMTWECWKLQERAERKAGRATRSRS